MATCVHLGTCDGNGAQFNVYTTWQSVIAATASQRRPDNVKIRKWKKVRNSTLQCIRLKHIAHTIPPTIRMLTDAFLFTFLFLRPIYFSMESNEWWSIKSTKKKYTTSSSSNDDHIHNDNTVNRFLFSVCCCRFPWIFFSAVSFTHPFHSSLLQLLPHSLFFSTHYLLVLFSSARFHNVLELNDMAKPSGRYAKIPCEKVILTVSMYYRYTVYGKHILLYILNMNDDVLPLRLLLLLVPYSCYYFIIMIIIFIIAMPVLSIWVYIKSFFFSPTERLQSTTTTICTSVYSRNYLLNRGNSCCKAVIKKIVYIFYMAKLSMWSRIGRTNFFLF